jgi:hypothetical protein
LVCSGLALAALGFLLAALAPPKPEGGVTRADEANAIADIAKGLAELLKQAGGLGIAVMLLGVVLLTGTALGTESTDSEQSGTPTVAVSTTPTP